MAISQGYLSESEIEQAPGFPGWVNAKRKRVAILECVQEIPCNPCESACPIGAITIGKPITNLPSIDAEKCIGCGICISRCPGLAIFVLDMTNPDLDLVMVPYEYLPLPEDGKEIECLDRQGRVVEIGRVKRVLVSEALDETAVITVEVSKGLAMEVRAVRVAGDLGVEHVNCQGDHGCDSQEASLADTLVCRCEEVSRGQVLDAIRAGAHDLDAVKRVTRAGMGLCQGRNCGKTIASLIGAETGLPMSTVLKASKRPPARPTRIDALSHDAKADDSTESFQVSSMESGGEVPNV